MASEPNCVILMRCESAQVAPSQCAQFFSTLVTLVSTIVGIILLGLGMGRFTSGWYLLAQGLRDRGLVDSEEDFYGPGFENEENEPFDHLKLKPFIILCTIGSIISEVCTALIISKFIVATYYRIIRACFQLKKDDGVLNSSAFLVLGVVIFLLALVFNEFHAYVLLKHDEGSTLDTSTSNSTLPTESLILREEAGFDPEMEEDFGHVDDSSEESYESSISAFDSFEGNVSDYEEETEMIGMAMES